MRKPFIIISFLFVAVFVFSKCINNTAESKDPRGNLYAGANACRKCHESVYDEYTKTAHFNSTAAAGKENVHGDFTAIHNSFTYADGSTVKMEAGDSGVYQSLYVNGQKTGSYRFDIVFGGRHAQTSVNLRNGRLYELPISFYKNINGWATSPGYNGLQPFFNRTVIAGCFECHASSIKVITDMVPGEVIEKYVEGSLIHGIDCERCHGPGQNHVNYHEAYPDEKQAKYMLLNHTLSRQQKTDACAVCHSGNDRQKMKSLFEFKMGDTLEDIYMPFGKNTKSSDFDVHGNQYRLLAQSKCYLQTSTMTCNTCHSPHGDAEKSLAVYSSKCMDCHSEANHNFCPEVATLGESIKNNCIDCHMPTQPSKAIMFQTMEKKDMSAYMLRNHRIAVYP